MDLQRLNYWLLDYAAASPLGERATIGMLGAHPDFGWNGAAPHGATVSELAEAIAGLEASGLIHGGRIDGEPRAEHRIALDPATVEIALEEREWGTGGPLTFYSLTDAGGAAWEAEADPDWSRYVHDLGGTSINNAPMNWSVEAATEEYAQRYVDYVCARDGVSQPDREVTPLRPWRAKSWKTLPSGVRVEFLHDSFFRSTLGFESDSEFYTPGPRWYTRPWESETDQAGGTD